MSDYFRQNHGSSSFNSSESWMILNNIEQKIKYKIESLGTKLKDWDIKIYRGILTGFNEAFIIDGKRKEELIANDPKSAEIIRPLLRGRDIKRYSYEFADLYIITTFPSLNINIDYFPAVKQHLMDFGYDRLKQTGDIGSRKKTNNKWFETQDSIGYWEDFYKQKIVWGNLNLKASYALVPEGYFVNAPSPFIVPASNYLLAVLNSKIADYYIRSLGVTRNGGYFEYKPMFVEALPVPMINEDLEKEISKIIDDKGHSSEEIDDLLFRIYKFTPEEIDFIVTQ
jgi:adenine-specific DNA-methyltransferase